MKWAALFLQLLPTIISAVEKVGGHLAGHEKKAAVQDGLAAVAAGVGVILPEHATAAFDAAAVASDSIDGVVKVLNDVGALAPHASTTGSGEKASIGSITPQPVVDVPAAVAAPGLHNVVPA